MEPIKERIEHYWSHRAEAWRELRLKEFEDDKHERWLAELRKYLPQGRPLRILDLGTGTGFFSLILAAEGHSLTGIDLTPEMIRGAKVSAGILELPAEFLVMDAEQPDFPPESFDALVTRNLTWTLPHLPRAYGAWYELLKPGGVLVNFDADYYRAQQRTDRVLPENHAHKALASWMVEENREITREVGERQQPRPQWDVQLLTECGFERIIVDNGVWKRIYAEVDEFYNPVPIFTIAAYKA